MNVIQFTPRRTADPGLFEPLSSLAGLRPGDSIEQTGRHAARLSIDLSPAPDGVDVRKEGRTLRVAAPGGRILRRLDLADGVSVTAKRRTKNGIEIDFQRSGSAPTRASA